MTRQCMAFWAVAGLAIFCSPARADLFGSPRTYFLGSASEPASVACCDLDDDGWEDAVAAAAGLDSVFVLFNDRTDFGTFQTPVPFSVGQTPISVACADLDGDSDNDIVAANYVDSTLSVLRNDGDRTFVHLTLGLGTGVGPRCVACCDLNDDQVLDLVTANDPPATDDTFTVLLGTGAGGFAAPVTAPVGGASADSVLCADFNGDDVPDLASALKESGVVSVLIGCGDGTFLTPVTYPVASGPQVVAAGDLDGDDDLDIAVNAVWGDSV